MVSDRVLTVSIYLIINIYSFVDLLWAYVSTGVAKEGVVFKNVTPIVARGQRRPTPLFVCLVRHGKCSTYQTKQKMKKHLFKVHNFVEVEVGVGGQPCRPRSRPSRTTREQNKRYNTKSRSNPLSKVAVLDSKAKSWFEISVRA